MWLTTVLLPSRIRRSRDHLQRGLSHMYSNSSDCLFRTLKRSKGKSGNKDKFLCCPTPDSEFVFKYDNNCTEI